MKKNKVAVIWGGAVIDAPGKITIKASKNEAPKSALGRAPVRPARGSRHRRAATRVPDLAPDRSYLDLFRGRRAGSHREVTSVIGSSAIGMEFASFLAPSVRVLPWSNAAQILPAEDQEIQAFAQSFEKRRQDPHRRQGDQLDERSDERDRDHRSGRSRRRLEVEHVISAVGVVGISEIFGLEKLG